MCKDNTTSDRDIFEDRESLLKIWSEERKSRDFNASLMWENFKLYAVLIPAIITIDALFLRLIFDVPQEHISKLLWFSLVFPSLILGLSVCGNIDLFRRWKRTSEAIAHLNELEKLLGLDRNLPKDKRVFKDDPGLFPRWHASVKNIHTENQFINRNILKFNMFTSMTPVYVFFLFVGTGLIYFQIQLIYS
jgi:hypothetical protein